MIEEKFITHAREPFFDIAKTYIYPSSKVLDVGSGMGDFSDYCKRKDFFLYDGNPETVINLKERFKNVYLGYLPKLPFESQFFDVIHCSHVIEHLKPQELYDTLKEFDRCLTNDGYLVISTPLLWEGFFDDLSHVKPYSPKVLIKYLCKNKEIPLTREKISSKYNLVKIQYRYKDSWDELIYFDPKRNFSSRVFYYIFNILKSNGLKYLVKTGYTIVLRKNA